MNSDSSGNAAPFPSPKVHRGTDNTMTEVAAQVRAKSLGKWGPNQSAELVGVSPKMRDTLDKV
jgi:hypothetical protein